jgi:MFS family permease
MTKAATAPRLDREQAPPRAKRALLADGRFLRLWAVGGLANTMRWLELLAAGIYVFDATDSAFLAAAVTALRSMPMLFFGAMAGALAERIDRRLLLISGMLAMTTTAGLLALSALLGTIAVWQIALGAVVNGLYWSSELSVRRTLLGEAAGHERISAAMAFDSATANASRMMGPFLGGLVYELIGLPGAYAVSALFYAAAGLIALQVRPIDERRAAQIRTVFAKIGEGLRFAGTRPLIAGTLAITFIMNFFGFPYSSLVPAIGRDELGLNATLIGLLASGEGTGALIGSTMIAFSRRNLPYARTVLLGSLLLLLSTFLFSLSSGFGFAFAALVLGGIGSAGFGTMQTTLILTETPFELRARIMGVLTMFIGTGPLGMLSMGLLAAWLGPSHAVTLAAGTGFVCAGAVAFRFAEMRR